MHFQAFPLKMPGLSEKLAAHAPENPFHVVGYLSAVQSFGAEVWIGGLFEEDSPVGLSGLFLWRGRLNSTLVIASLPVCASLPEYWSGLVEFGQRQGMTQIDANSFASPSFTVPAIDRIRGGRDRFEYVLDLTAYKLDGIHAKHRYSIRRAGAAGLKISRSCTEDACREHVRVVSLSQDRHRMKGESIDVGTNFNECASLCREGCAEVFQATAGGVVLSSATIMRSKSGAYYHTAGNAPEGLACGASHFLIHNAACLLQDDGVSVFNLGGAQPDTSLATYKERFGAKQAPLKTVKLYIGRAWRERVTIWFKWIKSTRARR